MNPEGPEGPAGPELSSVKRFYRNLKNDLDKTSAYTGWFYRANDSSVEINDGKSFLKISSSPANSQERLLIWHNVEIAHKSDLIHIRDQIVCAASCKQGEGGGGGSYEFTVPISAALALHAMENNRQAVIFTNDFKRLDVRISVPVEDLISFFYKLFTNKSPWKSPADGSGARPSLALRSIDSIASYFEGQGIPFIVLDNDEDPNGAVFKFLLS